MLHAHAHRRTRLVAVAAAAVVVADQATKALAPLAHNGCRAADAQPRPAARHRRRKPDRARRASWPPAHRLRPSCHASGRSRHTAAGRRRSARRRRGLANLADRAVLGSVRDFIVIGHTIVVNVADLAVAIGLVIYLCARLRDPIDRLRTPQ